MPPLPEKFNGAMIVPSGSTAAVYTVLIDPPPMADHDVPFQRAMRLTMTLPAWVNEPVARMSPFGSRRRPSTAPLRPGPRVH